MGLSELFVFEKKKDLLQPCKQKIGAIFGQAPYEQVEGGWLKLFVVEVACAHG
jgi:hypothetical protein